MRRKKEQEQAQFTIKKELSVVLPSVCTLADIVLVISELLDQGAPIDASLELAGPERWTTVSVTWEVAR